MYTVRIKVRETGRGCVREEAVKDRRQFVVYSGLDRKPERSNRNNKE